MQHYDYVIVGAGSAGCVLANRLSANGKYTVCLLEAGPPDRYPWIHIPIGYGKTMFHKTYNWGFETEPDQNLNGRQIYQPRGRTLGGSSSINGLIYIRGQSRDYDEWATLGNPDWSWERCLPYFRRLEHNDLGASSTRGEGGPMWATTVPGPNKLVDAFISASQACGVPRVADFNDGKQEGVGYFQLSTKNGFRCSTASGYLKPARGRPNLTVETDAQVTRVLMHGKRAIGVLFQQNGKCQELQARKEVLLCAGAIQTPQLLQLSGIGATELLTRYQVPVVHHLPGVGENLQDHLQVRLMYEVSEPITTNDTLKSLSGQAKMGLQWLLNRSGPLAVGINMGGMFCRSLPDENPTPDTQFHFATLSADHAAGKVHPFSGCTYSVCQLRPEARGYVRIKSSDPFDAPAIQANYLSTETDKRTTVAAVKFARKVAASAPMNSLMKREFKPGPEVRTDDEILEFCRNHASTIFHPAGTAKMGPEDDPLAVVDQRLRVHGLQGIRVVDCSIMPTLVSGNTNIPTVMIAEKAADYILQDALTKA
ncbi:MULTISPECIES: GMC family oxidoreductase [Pseudomonas]|uniref:GMC family oxidoreductase n=1 Tax=Pseudomonas TaxID=286 RepID=UPI0007619C29|nr:MULTISPECIES: choline dehydrogenase [Pseudomonas]MBI6922564.1 choline dehydrogenase [Pseudomonas monteilii]MBM3112278.1 choline dehydrogenase [Pseudomonas arcuscaelestis]MCE0939425.1 choline dehydrogenase [Pseudomonas kurunegalensis]MCE0974180.1 choline dehydrogenase [Pseudomonas putida]MCZ9640899.1 choline dehydrogenase [Pseudomonas putida]